MVFKKLAKSLKESVKAAASATAKTAKKLALQQQRKQQINRAKREVLVDLSLKELDKLAIAFRVKDNIIYKEEFDPETLSTKVRKIKPSKMDYIDYLADNIPYTELILGLENIGKKKLAHQLERKVILINEEFNRKIKLLEKSEEVVENEKDNFLKMILDKIVEEICSMDSESYRRESYFQTELLGMLKGALPKVFGKLGKVYVEKEYPLSSGERVDLYIQIGAYRIGIETKLFIDTTSKLQKLQGQIYNYSKDLDALIVVQYAPIEDRRFIQQLRNFIESQPFVIKVIAGGVEVI